MVHLIVLRMVQIKTLQTVHLLRYRQFNDKLTPDKQLFETLLVIVVLAVNVIYENIKQRFQSFFVCHKRQQRTGMIGKLILKFFWHIIFSFLIFGLVHQVEENP